MSNYATDTSLELIVLKTMLSKWGQTDKSTYKHKCGKGAALHEILSDESLINDSAKGSICQFNHS